MYYMTADLQTMHVELPSTEVLCVYMRKVIVFWNNFKSKNLCGDRHESEVQSVSTDMVCVTY